MNLSQPPQPLLSSGEIRNSQDDEINLIDLLDVVLDGRWLIAVITVLVLFAGVGYAVLSTPIFEANTLVQVEETKAGGGAASSALGEAASLFDIRSPASAEMELLRSRLIIGQAVENLQLSLTVIPKYSPLFGQWLSRTAIQPSQPGMLGFGGYVNGSESLKLSVFDIPAAYQSPSFQFIVVITQQGYDLMSPEGNLLTNGVIGQLSEFSLGGSKGTISVTSYVGLPGAQFHVHRVTKLSAIQNLQQALLIAEQGKQSGIIRATLSGDDPTKIAVTLNEIGALYVRQNIARKAAEAEKTLSFLGILLPQLRAQADESETKFNQFRNKNTVFDLSTEAKLVLEQSVKLQTNLLELQQKRKELETKFTAQHPSVQTIDSQIKSVNTELGNLAGKVKVFPTVEQDLLRLTRDLKVNNELYASLLNSSQQLRLVKEGKVGNVRIVDVAVVPESQVKPKRLNVVGSALACGLLLGLGAVFLRNAMRPGIKDPADIEQHNGLNVFATVPLSQTQHSLTKKIKAKANGTHVLALEASQDPAIEGLRSLRTALQFAMLEATSNIVLITGPTPGIGKSFTSVNFAAVMAAANKKVLLIDADLRKGYMNQYFGLPRGNGLSELVAGSATWADALHKQVIPNLDFLSTGIMPPNPAEVLMTMVNNELVSKVSRNYDIVILDTAPVLVASDTSILAAALGTVFLVAKAEVTSMAELVESVKRLRQSGSDAKGVIFNSMDIFKRRYSIGAGNKYSKYRYTNYKY